MANYWTAVAAWFAAGEFQVEPTKGYVGINATPLLELLCLLALRLRVI